MSGIAEFVEDYRRALEACDAEALADFYRTPLPVIRPDRMRVVEDRATLAAELLKIVDFYRWAGMRRLEIHHLRIDGFDPGLHVVSLTWRPMTGDGLEIALIDVTFAIRRTMDSPRIAAVIAHNEERHREPILRQSLAALETRP